MEEYLNLYHQKLWEVANDNIVGVFINPLILSLVLFFVLGITTFIKTRRQ